VVDDVAGFLLICQVDWWYHCQFRFDQWGSWM